MQNPIRNQKLIEIERLRGIAIFSVVLYHLSLSRATFEVLGLDGNRMPLYLGVNLFFVISGYIVTMTLIEKKEKWYEFYIKRIFRIWPALFFFFILCTALNLSGKEVFFFAEWKTLVGDFLFLLVGLLNGERNHSLFYFGATWSLVAELQFLLFSSYRFRNS